VIGERRARVQAARERAARETSGFMCLLLYTGLLLAGFGPERRRRTRGKTNQCEKLTEWIGSGGMGEGRRNRVWSTKSSARCRPSNGGSAQGGGKGPLIFWTGPGDRGDKEHLHPIMK